MDLTTFLQQRRADWRRLEEILERVEGSGLPSLDEAQAIEFGRLYRRAASDLNQAQTFVSGEATVGYLNDLVARCYLVIYTRARVDVWGVIRYLLWGDPAVFRKHFGHFLLAVSIFTLATVFGFLASYFDPVIARPLLLPNDFPMIQPAEEGEEDTTPAATTGEMTGFSGFLFRHNVSVTLVAFALGITWGIGTAWLMWETGVMTGTLMAVFVEAGQFRSFCTGILPHGVLEIPAALIGGAAGFMLAQAMIQARPWPRLQELARAGREAVWMVGGAIPLLAVAAILEAFVARAPDRYLDSGFKLFVAGLFGTLFVAYLVLLGWGRRARPAEEGSWSSTR
jgi:uncharacterized membrane protein SpoIIM required for sporulation